MDAIYVEGFTNRADARGHDRRARHGGEQSKKSSRTLVFAATSHVPLAMIVLIRPRAGRARRGWRACRLKHVPARIRCRSPTRPRIRTSQLLEDWLKATGPRNFSINRAAETGTGRTGTQGERRMGANPHRQRRHSCFATCGCRISATMRKPCPCRERRGNRDTPVLGPFLRDAQSEQ